MAKPNLTSTHQSGILEDFATIICNFIRIYTPKIRSLIMQNTPPPTPPRHIENIQREPATKTKIPSLSTRRAACTHLTMDRLYGDYECNICRRPSQLGWVYLCTQDDTHPPGIALVNETLSNTIPVVAHSNEVITNPQKPTFDLASDCDPDGNVPEYRMPTADLALWMEKAIEEGHYTAEQVMILQAQKQNVVDVALAAIEQYEREAKSKDVAFLPVSSPPKETTQSGNEDVIEGTSPQPQVKLKMFPYCKFRACQACRFTFRDRTWQKFDEVFAKDASAIIELEKHDLYGTRPLAGREVMQRIGLRASEPSAQPGLTLSRRRPGLIGNREMQLQNVDDPRETKDLPDVPGKVHMTNPASLESRDMADADTELEPDLKGFHENTHQALKGVLDRNNSLRSIKKRKMESEPKTGFDTALRKSLYDSLLKEAASVPLPEQDITEGPADEVGEIEMVELADGVAVKKESAELRAVDIITSM